MAYDLNGRWSCKEGGIYYIRQIGGEIAWYGEGNACDPGWSNVAFGNIYDDQAMLRWMDVPKGINQGAGMLVLKINSNDSFTATSKTGGFGGVNWTRI